MRTHQLAVLAPALIVLGSMISLSPRANAQTYDLAANWSDSSNPNGIWQYGTFDGSTSRFSAFPHSVNSYIDVGPVAFNGTQPAWTDTLITGNNGFSEGLAESVGNLGAGLDFPIVRVGGHTPASSRCLAIQWTAAGAGTVNLVGGTWMLRDIGRDESISLFDNGTPLFQDVAIPTQPMGVNSSNTFRFAEAMLAGGGTEGGLSNIPVAPGDKFLLVFAKLPGSTEDFVGTDYTVNFTPAVSPTSPTFYRF